MVILADECTALCLITLIADQKIEPSRPEAELMTGLTNFSKQEQILRLARRGSSIN